jgi:hypothetical protein
MNIQDTLAHIFPSGVVSGCRPDKGGSFEVLKLPQGAVPQNCEVLASCRATFARGRARRESYLVKTEDFVIFFRVCPAWPAGDSSDLVLGVGYAPVGAAQSLALQALARKSMETLRK